MIIIKILCPAMNKLVWPRNQCKTPPEHWALIKWSYDGSSYQLWSKRSSFSWLLVMDSFWWISQLMHDWWVTCLWFLINFPNLKINGRWIQETWNQIDVAFVTGHGLRTLFNTVPSRKTAHGYAVLLTLGQDWGMGRYSRNQYRVYTWKSTQVSYPH